MREKGNRGITMVSLIVTIVVLLILSTVSVKIVFGEKGFLYQVEGAKNRQSTAITQEDEKMNKVLEEHANAMVTEPDIEPKVTLATDIKTTTHGTIETEDGKGNKVVIPGGFKIAESSGKTVQDGIIVEDAKGNQFVWVPVSNINHDGSNLITKNDGTKVEITLGRYTFDTTGKETKVQYGIEHNLENIDDKYTIDSKYQELVNFREANQVNDTTGTNATAKNLGAFIASVDKYKGYYIARYEASFGSGTEFGVGKDEKFYKPLSQKSTLYHSETMTNTSNKLWNFITQGNASLLCRNMYYGNYYVESDLINSYMWDTTLVYIQVMGNANYANATTNTNGNTGILKNTGDTNDEKCHIFDMAGNLREWTTENAKEEENANPCVYKGGYFGDSANYHTASTNSATATENNNGIGARAGLYIK